MKLKAPQFDIPNGDPFKNDLLARKVSADLLTELLISIDDPIVVCINAPWGSGKTTFLGMWRQQLKNLGFNSLYFNAWENDFSDNALVSLIGEFNYGLSELECDESSKNEAKIHLVKAKKLGTALIKRSIPSAVKFATAGIVDLGEIAKEVLPELAETLAEEQIKRYEESKTTVKGFKAELSEFARKLVKKEGGDGGRPLVVFVDELDRCRPPYAVDVLERIKHFFSTENVVFVLALDKAQLNHSLRTMYGVGMDVNGYLRRFIDLDFNLPSPNKADFCKAQFSRFGLKTFFEQRQGGESRHDLGWVEGLLSDLFSVLDFTLREQEQSFAILSMAIRTTPGNMRLYPQLLVVLIVLKMRDPDLFVNFVAGKCTYYDVAKFLRSSESGQRYMDSPDGARLEGYLARDGNQGGDKNTVLAHYTQVIRSEKSSESERQRAQTILDIVAKDHWGGNQVLGYLAGKIDLVSQIVE